MPGNSQGSIFAHLSVNRELIKNLTTYPWQRRDYDFDKLLVFALESYAYFSVVTNITPYGVLEHRTLPLDSSFDPSRIPSTI